MMRTLKNLEMHELIGLSCEVVESTNPLQVGIAGNVVDETKNTIVIESENGYKMIQKKGAVFRFRIGDGYRDVFGDRIAYRPHERTKKVMWRRRKW